MNRGAWVVTLTCLLTGAAVAAEPDPLIATPLATAFGSAPAFWGAKLSPDGSKISYIQVHPEGVTYASVLDSMTGSSAVVLAGQRDEYDVAWCDWANPERLLCGLEAVVDRTNGPGLRPITRLVAVNADGSAPLVLLESLRDDVDVQFLDEVIDWLPDDREHVLVQKPETRDREWTVGTGVARLNIYTGRTETEESDRESVYQWITDGYGVPRLYRRTSALEVTWFVKDTPDSRWSELHRRPLDELDDHFAPIGFGTSRTELLFFDMHEGRSALFAMDLVNERERRLIYANDSHDVTSALSLGKHRRLVAASYVDDRPRLHFFDQRVEEVQALLEKQFPGKLIAILDEDWNQRFYLVFVGDDRDPGNYYRLDVGAGRLAHLTAAYPTLEGRVLAPMQEIRYEARDGTLVPAYLTRADSTSTPAPAVILPHGGPSSRDYWSFDYLAQFFAAQGFVVLQSNYRGSSGYGLEWEGEGAFKGWRQTIADITDGTQYLIEEGLADPQRICVVGWSYGGYAALMSVIEAPALYRCAASIAGVTDPKDLGAYQFGFIGGVTAELFIGRDEEVVKAGSPLERVSELERPVLLFHARKDLNVPFDQSERLSRVARRESRAIELIEYEHAAHSIEPERYRIDLLARLSQFLETHTTAPR